ncbi:MAG: glycosyltransferase [Deltaproteobacteria bacterium]|jgi:glycosyltransferase involved in cell wall biosynthesis|nr:glycosyltransferase [Deltaproteobacteria bacterium]
MPLFFQKGQNLFLKDKGFEIHLIASDDIYLNQVKERDKLFTYPLNIERRPSIFKDIYSLLKIILLLRRIKPDIVHAGAPKSSFLGLLAAWLCRVKGRFFACHGTIAGRHQGLSRVFYRFIEKCAAFWAKRVWCVSPSLLEFMNSEGIVPKDKGFSIGQGSANGFKREWLEEEDAEIPEAVKTLRKEKDNSYFPIILFIGRICSDKGIEIITEAWVKLRELYPKLRFLIIGSHDLTNPVDNNVLNLLQNDDRVILSGYLSPGALGYCYETADILVAPSLGCEGFLNVVGEASLFSLPVIASNVVGPRDAVVDGVTGTLVPPSDPKLLCDAIIKYLDNPELAKKHGQAGRERYENYFKPEIIWETLYSEYSKLL